MHGDERDRLTFGIRAGLLRPGLIAPLHSHRLGEGAQAPRFIGAGHVEEGIDVGQGSLGATTATLPQYGTDAHLLDGLREEHGRRRRARASRQALQDLKRFAEQRIAYFRDWQPKVQTRMLVARHGQRGKRVEQRLLGQTHKRTAQKRAKCEGVPRIGKRRGQSDQVLDFLPTEKALAGLGRDGNRAGLQRPLVAPEFGAGRGQQRDVSGTAGPQIPLRSRTV